MTEGFYVSIIRSPRQRGLLLGPYDRHEYALLMVDLGRSLAINADQWAEFDAFGTCKVTSENLPKSVFGAL